MGTLPKMHLKLASGSPRRIELLGLTGWMFDHSGSSEDERGRAGEDPQDRTRRLALGKARSELHPASQLPILAADTLVIHNGQPLGKPASRSQARRMLQQLRGREHRVVTSIALLDPISGKRIIETCVSRVPMRDYSDADIETYLETGSPMDKAGAYGIQDRDFDPVEPGSMTDCFANVMGLPLCHLVRAMGALGLQPLTAVPDACMAHTGYDCPIFADILSGEA